MQETHITKDVAEQWKKEWGGELRYVEQDAHSGGQVVLFRPGLVSEIETIHCANRILALNTTILEKRLTILSVYAPNNDREKITFFDNLENLVKKTKLDTALICGDFNTVLPQ